uniref:Uncharacterized protein n=1 Tax=Nothobranchius furzeri TaxID=105023 RepID=A0A8C6NV35_NOTFU
MKSATYYWLLICHEHSEAGQVVAGTRCVCVVGVHQAATLCGPPAITGSVRYTLLDPLCTEAEMTCEFTTRLLRLASWPWFWLGPRPSRSVEFWVVRKEPRFL